MSANKKEHNKKVQLETFLSECVSEFVNTNQMERSFSSQHSLECVFSNRSMTVRR